MSEYFSLLSYLVIQGFGFVISVAVAAIFLFWVLRKAHSLKATVLLFLFFFGTFLVFWLPVGMPSGLEYPFGLRTYGPGAAPKLSFPTVVKFFTHLGQFERVPDIARDPTHVSPPLERTGTTTVDLQLTAKEVIAEVAPGVKVNYWTFDGTVPGPMLRVRQGDTVHLTLHNDSTSLHPHNIDLHAVTGPGGGAVVTNVNPGESRTFTFQALNPGLYVYHCAHQNVTNHVAHGMYGLILVEPPEGLPPVDKEFYIMQGELYTAQAMGRQGLQIIDTGKMLDGHPEYVVFNGRVQGLNGKMQAVTGERVRLYVGNGGVNFVSSFHVIGEIFDIVYPEGAMGSAPHQNVQSTIVPAGGATIVEFGLEIPGNYVLVDHALSRVDRGAWGVLNVLGMERPEIFQGELGAEVHDHSGH